MLTNYLTIACRNLLRHKAFSFINVLGLAIGMACSILILLWVQDELSYDRFHRRAGQLYRITCRAGDTKAAVSPAALAGALKAQMSQVKNTVRVMSATHLLEVSSRKFEENRIFYVDASFLEMFSFPLRQGDPRTALQRPDGILMTETMARKYFGQAEALGRTLRKDNGDPVTVTGILADVPGNSHLQFDFIRPMAAIAGTNEDLKNNRWDSFNFYSYVQLDEKVAASPELLSRLNGQITQIYRKNFPEFKVDFQLQPLGRIHLHSETLVADVTGHGNIQYVRTFFVVALFILAVASINFMNLATARSARRAKEVGLRKVIGAGRMQLIGQFLGESLLISFLGLLIAIGFVWALLPLFNDLSDKRLALHFGDGKLMLSLLALALLTGLLSGSYPALFLSRFQPVNVLKGNLQSGRGNVWFRNGLVVVQFVVSIVLLVGTAVVYQQLQYIKNRNLGFQKENLLYISMNGELWGKYRALRTELARNPLTEAYAVTQELPTNLISADPNVQWEGKDPRTQTLFYHMAVDENFIGVFGMKLLSGRSFSREFKADSANFVVNEKALRLMGMDVATAVGKSLAYYDTKGTIIGVVQDFNFKPIQQPIEPLILRLNTWGGTVVVRTRPGRTEATIGALEQIWGKLNPAYP
ncbi:MAG: ABC transporter permease, partial [Cytophagales bacterium]|nr:ABC transporter permease [Cytophagales bacterium]